MLFSLFCRLASYGKNVMHVAEHVCSMMKVKVRAEENWRSIRRARSNLITAAGRTPIFFQIILMTEHFAAQSHASVDNGCFNKGDHDCCLETPTGDTLSTRP